MANCEGKCKHKWCSGGAGNGSSAFSIDMSHVLGNTSQQFVSFTFDLSAWALFERDNNFSDPAFITAARSFAPALLRIGGTAEDNTTYDMRDGAPEVELGIPERTMTKSQWDGMNAFAEAAGWQILFGLNALKGWNGEEEGWTWDPTNARELIQYSLAKKYPVAGWELGNVRGQLAAQQQQLPLAAPRAAL